jgi:hypothetical protein
MRKVSFIPLFHPKVFSRIAVRGYRIGEACRLPFFCAFITRLIERKTVPDKAHLGYKEIRGVKHSKRLNFRAFRRNWVFLPSPNFRSVLKPFSYSLKKVGAKKKSQMPYGENFAPLPLIHSGIGIRVAPLQSSNKTKVNTNYILYSKYLFTHSITYSHKRLILVRYWLIHFKFNPTI